MSSPIIITDEAVFKRLHVDFPSLVRGRNCFILDEAYEILDDSKAGGFFGAVATGAQKIVGIYQTRRKDCDKFSRMVQALALAAHASTPGPSAGIAMAVLNYVKDDDGGGHSVNLMITHRPGEEAARLVVYDPQTAELVLLTSSEKASVTMCLI